MSSMTVLTVGGGLDHHHCMDSSQSINGDSSPTTYLLLTGTANTDSSKPVSAKTAGQTTVLRAKRKIRFANGTGGGGGKGPAPPAVARRNERERNRVRQVNLGFATLRQHVPNGAKSKKMSKVETLRSAVQYIKQLQQLLNETTGQDGEENSLPSFEEVSHMAASIGHRQFGRSDSFIGLNVTSPPYSTASSPNPSLGSDASSPYGSLSPEDEDLLDFTWLA